MRIRKATVKDFDRIHELDMKGTMDHYKKYCRDMKDPRKFKDYYYDHFKKLFRKKTVLFLVAEEKGEIIGYCLGEIDKCKKTSKYNKKGYMSEVYVTEKYRKEGVAKKLVKELFKWFRTKKVKWIRLDVYSKNKRAIRFWEEIGFEEDKKEMVLILK